MNKIDWKGRNTTKIFNTRRKAEAFLNAIKEDEKKAGMVGYYKNLKVKMVRVQ